MKNIIKYGLYFISLLIIIMGISRWRVVSVSNGHILESNEFKNIEICQNILLLGAKVTSEGNMSPILKERAMVVTDLYKRGVVCKIVISGYRELKNDYVYDEVTPVRKYLIEQGIPKDIIINDYEGMDTFMSLKNLQEIFGINSIMIVTQKFHLPRAVYIGQMLELDTSGFIAYKYPYPTKLEMYKDIAREWPAALKAVWQVEINNYN